MNDTRRLDALWAQHRTLDTITAEMHSTGMWVNKQWRDFLTHCAQESIEQKRQRVVELVNVDGFEATPHQLRGIIYRRHAKPSLHRFDLPDPYDKKMFTDETCRTISVSEDKLLLLMVSGGCPDELLPIIEAWWDYQGELKRRSMLTSEKFDQAIGPDNRLRPGWNSCGTDTGRFACSKPNVMNIEQMLRAVFGPPPGYVWVHADKSQLELRVMAVVAADNVLTDALNTGDVYSYDAKNMFNLPADANVKKDHAGLRKSAKIIRLGRQYGAGEKTILGQALRQDRRFTFARTKLLVKTWDKVNYRIPEYWREEMSRVQECSYSESRLMMRRRYYPRPPDLNETVNYPVQATAADIMNTEIITVWKRLAVEVPAARIVTQLHDAIDVECREADQPAVERIIDEEMNREWTFCGRTAAFPIERKTATHTDTWSAV